MASPDNGSTLGGHPPVGALTPGPAVAHDERKVRGRLTNISHRLSGGAKWCLVNNQPANQPSQQSLSACHFWFPGMGT